MTTINFGNNFHFSKREMFQAQDIVNEDYKKKNPFRLKRTNTLLTNIGTQFLKKLNFEIFNKHSFEL